MFCEFALLSRPPLPSRGHQQLQTDLIMSRADMLDVPRTRRLGYTICTAVAPDAVFTARTNGDTRALYDHQQPGLVSNPAHRTRRTAGHSLTVTEPVSQVRNRHRQTHRSYRLRTYLFCQTVRAADGRDDPA